MYRPQQRVNGRGETIVAGDIATITTRDGDKVSGEVSFNVADGNIAVVRDSGYTYIGNTQTMEKGNTERR